MKYPEQFWTNVSIADSGCWEWLGKVSKYGYATFLSKPAHRLVYRWFVNPTIPEKHHVHHQCRNRKCVNPLHLKALTPQDHATEHGANPNILLRATRNPTAKHLKARYNRFIEKHGGPPVSFKAWASFRKQGAQATNQSAAGKASAKVRWGKK